MKRSVIVAWYLEQIADHIESEDELLERKVLVEKVLDRLIHHVSHSDCQAFFTNKFKKLKYNSSHDIFALCVVQTQLCGLVTKI